MSTAPLFESPNFLTVDEQLKHIYRLLEKKCITYNITTGIFKTAHGPVDHTALVTYKTRSGESKSLALTGESISDLYNQIITPLEQQTL